MTSYLRDIKDPTRYYMYSLFDGDPQTAWLEGVKGDGVGESIEVKFVKSIVVDKIEIMPGFFDQQWYSGNNRIKKARIELEVMYNIFNGKQIPAIYLQHSYDIVFPDKMEKCVLLDFPVQVCSFKLTILEVYPSTADEDTAISEIAFLSKDKPYNLIRSKNAIAIEEKIYHYLSNKKSFAIHSSPGMGGFIEYWFSADGTFYIMTAPNYFSGDGKNILTGGYWVLNSKDSTISLIITEKLPTHGQNNQKKILSTQTYYIFDLIVRNLYVESMYGGWWDTQKWDIEPSIIIALSQGNYEPTLKLWKSEP